MASTSLPSNLPLYTHRSHSDSRPGRADCQLLKVFLLAWVFSLPFVIVEECGYFTPFVMALIAIAFFGLDQVGAELENPFGTDDNDFPLLHMGLGLMDNMDSMLRTVHNHHHSSRMSHEKSNRKTNHTRRERSTQGRQGKTADVKPLAVQTSPGDSDGRLGDSVELPLPMVV